MKRAAGSSGDDEGRSKQAKESRKVPTKVIDKIVAALVALGCPSSAQAVVKYCSTEFLYENAKLVRKTLKTNPGGKLVAITPTKFWVAGLEVPAENLAPSVRIEEIRAGSGAVAESGDRVSINYSLSLAADPDTVVETGKRFEFEVGGGEVIKGMDAGVLGLAQGGKRTIHVPWKLGYGKRGSKPDIPGEADLVFDIELVKLTKD